MPANNLSADTNTGPAMKKLPAFVFCLSLCGNLLAQQPAAPAAEPAKAAPAASPSTSNTFAERIPAQQLLTLDANGDKFLGRHIPDLSGEPRGAAIIITDSAQNPAWPFTAAALSDDLPLHGWDTLSIELPAPDIAAKQPITAPVAATATAAAPPPQPTATPPAAAPTATSTPADTGAEPHAQARIAAALKYYADQQTKNVVIIGFGSGAIRSAEFLRQYATNNSGKLEPISALVMVMPTNTLAGIDGDLPKILPSTAAPALDLMMDSSPLAKADAEARRRAVLHQRERIYRQLQLPPINESSDAQHSLMVKRVRAWLQQNASTNPPQKN